jgi:4-hydroxy-tetrahydrodipicolinate synthase
MGIWQEQAWACTAVTTPFTAEGTVDVERLAAFGKRQLAAGINGLAIFGTCGEGPCIPAHERIRATERLIERGLPADRMILGIGSAAPAEMVWMARQAGELGLAATLATPPFYFREVTDEGLHRGYADLAERAGEGAPPLMLYHIPGVTGMPLAVELIDRLATAFPGRIAGVKDSGADMAYTKPLLARLAGRMTIVVGAEVHVQAAMTLGAKGTICGLGNVAPALIARLVAGDAAAASELKLLVQRFDGVSFIPAVKAILADEMSDDAWRRVLPPLAAMAEAPPPAG